MVLGADLGAVAAPDPDKTTLGDDPGTRQLIRQQALHRRLWSTEADASRRRRYQLYEELYQIPEARQILRLVCGFIHGGDASHGTLVNDPFTVEFGEGAPAETVEALTHATGAMRLKVHVPQQLQSGLLKGDGFGQVIHSLTQVVALKPHVASDVDVEWDAFGRLSGYRVTGHTGRTGMGHNAGVFVGPLQMVHYAPHRRWDHRYGESFFHGLTSVGRQFNTAVDVTHVLVTLAAANRTRVSVQVPKAWTRKQIREFIRDLRLWNSDGAFFDGDGVMHKGIATLLDYADKVWPYKTGEAAPQYHDEPSARFDRLIQVAEFDRDRLFLGTGFPKALAGALEAASGLGGGSALTAADLALARMLRAYQGDEARLVLEYLARAAIIADVPIGAEDVSVRMAPIGAFNEKLVAETLKLRADAAVALGAIKVPMRWILKYVLRVDDEELEPLLLELEQSGAEPGGAEPSPAEAQRVREQFSEEVERLTEGVRMLTPVVATLDDPRVIAAIEAASRRTP